MSQHGVLTSEIITGTAVSVSAAGDNTALAAPTTGRRVFRAYFSTPLTNGAEVTINLLFAGGSSFYRLALAPGAFFFMDLGDHCVASGAVALIANLSAAQTVHISVFREDY